MLIILPKRKKIFLIFSLCFVSILSVFLVRKIIAADTAAVTATVTVQNISLSVSDGSITYGTMAVGTSKSTADIPDTQSVTNDGNIAEDINIKGSNSANWTLAATTGSNQYAHKFGVGLTALTTNYQILSSNLSVGNSSTFNLVLYTPTSSTVYTSQSVDVTVQAVAH